MISLTSPIKTRAHDWPVGMKLGALCLAGIALFFVQNIIVMAAILAGIFLLYASFGFSFLMAGLRQLWIVWPFLLIIFIWHLFYREIVQGGVICLRIVNGVALANFVTMTTKLTAIMGAIRYIARPLRFLGCNIKALEIAVALVIRTLPIMLIKGRALRQAWKARTHRPLSWRIIFPFTLLIIDDCLHVTDALKARGGVAEAPNDTTKTHTYHQ